MYFLFVEENSSLENMRIFYSSVVEIKYIWICMRMSWTVKILLVGPACVDLKVSCNYILFQPLIYTISAEKYIFHIMTITFGMRNK